MDQLYYGRYHPLTVSISVPLYVMVPPLLKYSLHYIEDVVKLNTDKIDRSIPKSLRGIF
jgi:hypothetical protein